ncbi:hypothetical protein [Asticcacaulis sp. AC460]|uniref:hypothetical protein n=1 Tax=Asticcacaulis sp. AC460 TaxID=1282360 RepID=UPI0012DF8798|nr:hypothetical protein [Asticcacaulis sp. AC460]
MYDSFHFTAEKLSSGPQANLANLPSSWRRQKTSFHQSNLPWCLFGVWRLNETHATPLAQRKALNVLAKMVPLR